MEKQNVEAQVMKYFAENTNLKENWRIAKQCAKEICGMKFNEIITGEIDLEIEIDVKEKIAQNIPYDFDSSDFFESGPIDFSGYEDDKIQSVLQKVDELYKKHIEAQAISIAKAVKDLREEIIQKLKNEVNEIKEKYLS